MKIVQSTLEATYPYRLIRDDGSSAQYSFKAADKSQIDVQFGGECYGDAVHIEFKRGGDYGVSGDGDAFKILATVNKIVLAYVTKYYPSAFFFTAAEPSRVKLYERLCQRLSIPGYKRVVNGSHYDSLNEALNEDEDEPKQVLFLFEDPQLQGV